MWPEGQENLQAGLQSSVLCEVSTESQAGNSLGLLLSYGWIASLCLHLPPLFHPQPQSWERLPTLGFKGQEAEDAGFSFVSVFSLLFVPGVGRSLYSSCPELLSER